MHDARPPRDDFPLVMLLVGVALIIGAWVSGEWLLLKLFSVFP